MAVSPQQTQRQCVSCGRNIAWDANVCPYCGRDYRQPAPGAPMMMAPQHPHSSLPLAGGILVIIAGVLELITAVMVMAGGSMLASLVGGYDFGIGGILVALGVIGLIVSALVIVGGFFATQRRSFAFSIVAAVLAMLGGVFTIWLLFAGSLLGLIGLILIAVAHDEFT